MEFVLGGSDPEGGVSPHRGSVVRLTKTEEHGWIPSGCTKAEVKVRVNRYGSSVVNGKTGDVKIVRAFVGNRGNSTDVPDRFNRGNFETKTMSQEDPKLNR